MKLSTRAIMTGAWTPVEQESKHGNPWKEQKFKKMLINKARADKKTTKHATQS